MYLEINKLISYFEYTSLSTFYYLNLIDYNVYCEKEYETLINLEIFVKNDFLLIPQNNRNEIMVKYLIKKNNQNLLQKQNDKDFCQKFHWYLEDNLLVDEWNCFENKELVNTAIKWCEQNQITFTLKEFRQQ